MDEDNTQVPKTICPNIAVARVTAAEHFLVRDIRVCSVSVRPQLSHAAYVCVCSREALSLHGQ